MIAGPITGTVVTFASLQNKSVIVVVLKFSEGLQVMNIGAVVKVRARALVLGTKMSMVNIFGVGVETAAMGRFSTSASHVRESAMSPFFQRHFLGASDTHAVPQKIEILA